MRTSSPKVTRLGSFLPESPALFDVRFLFAFSERLQEDDSGFRNQFDAEWHFCAQYSQIASHFDVLALFDFIMFLPSSMLI